jgi:hypothetical protein
MDVQLLGGPVGPPIVFQPGAHRAEQVAGVAAVNSQARIIFNGARAG